MNLGPPAPVISILLNELAFQSPEINLSDEKYT